MSDWTPEQTQTLLTMRADRQSHKAIAAALGTTRSAIAGRVYRLGLPLICPANAHHAPRRGKYADRSTSTAFDGWPC